MTEWQPRTEEYDHSWPHSFKWGVSAEGDVQVWQVKDAGKQDERQELEKLWGRPVDVRTGDVIGSAQFIPAEMHIDGSLVAPPELQIQVYYGIEMPQALADWFSARFPGIVVRKAHHRTGKVSEITYPHEEQVKWVWHGDDGVMVWNPDEDKDVYGHGEKILRDWGRKPNWNVRWMEGSNADIAGYAIDVGGNAVSVGVNSPYAPPKALSAVKVELAKVFPNKEIIMPPDREDPRADEFDPEMAKRDEVIDRAASARWAHANLTTPEGL